METEELLRRERPREAGTISPALQELAPPAWELTDSRGRRVPLSSAGYVLYFGRTYQLRVAGRSALGPPGEARLIGFPTCVAGQPNPQTITKHGREYRVLTLKVHRESGWLSIWRFPYEILKGDLTVECSEAEQNPPRLEWGFPVVARTPWSLGIVLLLAAGAILGWVLGQLESAARSFFTHGPLSVSNFEDWWQTLQTNPRFWLWPLVIAGLSPLIALTSNILSLKRRTRELELRFRRGYSENSTA
ncbi:MAG TPA: hypothetical protein VK395_11940 [Gemmataceae bacterium]|nr:hypothetical protein [Gemmataceae bacterium]